MLQVCLQQQQTFLQAQQGLSPQKAKRRRGLLLLTGTQMCILTSMQSRVQLQSHCPLHRSAKPRTMHRDRPARRIMQLMKEALCLCR